MDEVSRITSLFVEGTEYHITDDADGQPFILWINKLNPFQVEDARRDGLAARSQRMRQLAEEDATELMGQKAEMATWDDEALVRQAVGQRADELYLQVLNDMDTDKGFRDMRERVERMPSLLDDAGADPDDPRRTDVEGESETWLAELQRRQKKAQTELIEDLSELPREDLEKSYLARWRERLTIDVLMEHRQATEIFFSLRLCRATRSQAGKWNHHECDHSQRWLEHRKQVFTLPDKLIREAIKRLEGLTVGQREAGNSAAPTTSSASLEPSSPAEEVSTPSSPAETPSAVPTT